MMIRMTKECFQILTCYVHFPYKVIRLIETINAAVAITQLHVAHIVNEVS